MAKTIECMCKDPNCKYIAKAWQEKRCTGRTTRMLRNAIIHALVGRKVLVLFNSATMADSYKQTMRAICRRLDIDLPRGAVIFASANSRAIIGTDRLILRDHSVTGTED